MTLYRDPEGEEKAERTFNYNANGTTVKTTTVFHYNQNSALDKSIVYQGNVTQIQNVNGEVSGAVKRSVTLYIGFENEERVDRVFNYDLAGATIKTTSIYTYNSEDALTKITVYRSGITDAVPPATSEKISETTFVGPAGDEIVDFVTTYKPKAGAEQTVQAVRDTAN